MQMSVIADGVALRQRALQNRPSFDLIQRFSRNKERCGTSKSPKDVEQMGGDGGIWTIVVGQEEPWMIEAPNPAVGRNVHFTQVRLRRQPENTGTNA